MYNTFQQVATADCDCLLPQPAQNAPLFIVHYQFLNNYKVAINNYSLLIINYSLFIKLPPPNFVTLS